MAGIPSRLVAALADRYRLERELGQGGMATVYLARDLKHNRDVAIKVLKPELAAVLGAGRFVQEIATTAALQHPNILPLFDSGSADSYLYYVMPYVEGETLRARLDRETQLGVEESVQLIRELADALQYAHAHGVVHRDIKPENILIHAGRPTVADFGIALAVSAAAGGRMTETGLSLGTPHYMSPEQATAEKTITARSDIYSLASVLYEMLAGEPPHTGTSAQQIIRKIVTDDPVPITTIRRAVPPNVAAALAKALEKLPADRFDSAKTFADALANPAFAVAGTTAVGAAAGRPTPRAWLRAGAAGVLAGAAIAAAVIVPLKLHDRAAPTDRYRFAIAAGGTAVATHTTPQFAIADDGMTIAFIAKDSAGASQLWLRRLDQDTAQRVPGSDGASAPFWSPDSRSVGFFVGNTLERYTIGNTRPSPIGAVSGSSFTAAWMSDDEILFSPSNGPILRMSVRGGGTVPVTTLDSARGDIADVGPTRLADGRHFLYTALSFTGSSSGRVTLVGSLDGGTPIRVIDGFPAYAAPNHLIVVRNGDLVSLDFDQRTFQVHGNGVTIGSAETVGELFASANGTLVWSRPPSERHTSLELYDRRGMRVRTIGPSASEADHGYYGARFSSDGSRVAFAHHLGERGGDLYLFDLATGTATRETFKPTTHNPPGPWSPDGRRILINSTRSGADNIDVKTIGQSDQHLMVPPVAVGSFASDWSRDGGTILFDRPSMRTQDDVWEMPASGDSSAGPPKPLLASPANEMEAVFSPDGRWIAYASDETGRFEVYVRRYPLTGEQWKISADGGEAPRWQRDGKELFFLAPRGEQTAVMAASVELGSSFRSGRPVELFRKPIQRLRGFLRSLMPYDISPDGQRVAVIENDTVGPTRVPQVEVFVNALSAARSPH